MFSIDDFWNWDEYERQLVEGWDDNIPEPLDEGIYKNDYPFFSEIEEVAFFKKFRDKNPWSEYRSKI